MQELSVHSTLGLWFLINYFHINNLIISTFGVLVRVEDHASKIETSGNAPLNRLMSRSVECVMRDGNNLTPVEHFFGTFNDSSRAITLLESHLPRRNCLCKFRNSICCKTL